MKLLGKIATGSRTMASRQHQVLTVGDAPTAPRPSWWHAIQIGLKPPVHLTWPFTLCCFMTLAHATYVRHCAALVDQIRELMRHMDVSNHMEGKEA